MLASSKSSSSKPTSTFATNLTTALAADTTSTPLTGTSLSPVPSFGTSESTSSSRGPQRNSLSGGVVAGIVLGSIAIIAIVCLAGWLISRHRKAKTAPPESHVPPSNRYSNPTSGMNLDKDWTHKDTTILQMASQILRKMLIRAFWCPYLNWKR